MVIIISKLFSTCHTPKTKYSTATDGSEGPFDGVGFVSSLPCFNHPCSSNKYVLKVNLFYIILSLFQLRMHQLHLQQGQPLHLQGLVARLLSWLLWLRCCTTEQYVILSIVYCFNLVIILPQFPNGTMIRPSHLSGVSSGALISVALSAVIEYLFSHC